MNSLLKPIQLYLLFLVSASVTAELEQRDNITLKAPVVVPVSQYWDGVDGTWSTFEIRVGTPENVYRVLPATSWQETWVVYGAAAGVCNTTAGVPANCGDSRGGLFDSAASTTWEQGQQYTLGLNSHLGYDGVGQYGFDTVGLGFTNSTASNGGPTLNHQIVAAIVSDSWYLGMLGLGFQPTNFSGYGNPQPSFPESLFTQGLISSRSWSYTAGAYHRLKGVFGQLIFGGYDASRFTSNNVIFDMAQDNLRDLVVTLQSITASTSERNTTVLSSPIFAFIDSTVPDIWLPVSVCQQLEIALGLTFNQDTNLYLINTTHHSTLLSLNPSLTFTLSNQKTSTSPSLTISLPYAALSMNATSPFVTNTSSLYFPIRRANDESQYTLGRAFLQEAYITAHYHSRTFNVSQCVFDTSVSPHIKALPSILPSSAINPSDVNSPSGSGSRKKPLSGGAIAGIVIGSLLALVTLLALALLLFRRRRRRHQAHDQSTLTASPPTGEKDRPSYEIGPGKPDDTDAYLALHGGSRMPNGLLQGSGRGNAGTENHIQELPGHDAKTEIAGYPIMHPQELEGDAPSSASRTNATATATGGQSLVGHSPSGDDHIVSPASAGESVEGGGALRGERPRITVSSPSSEGHEARAWSPTTPVQRTGTGGSRFKERWS